MARGYGIAMYEGGVSWNVACMGLEIKKEGQPRRDERSEIDETGDEREKEE